MIALPFHPSNVYAIDELLANPGDILRKTEQDAAAALENPKLKLKLTGKIDAKGRIHVDQGVIAGCAGGTFDNLMAAAAILRKAPPPGAQTDGIGSGPFSLSIYPGSQPAMLELAKNGAVTDFITAGAVVRTAFCGPCFGAGDVPANDGLSIRHTTRNFPNREGSRPGNDQLASVALMDARSVAATARNGGILTSALGIAESVPAYHYDDSPYRARVYNGTGRPRPEAALRYGPNITDWPDMEALGENLLVQIVSYITDPVTTTDELIPSGETSSFRSNPLGLAEYTLSRKDPEYVGRAKKVKEAEDARLAGKTPGDILPELTEILNAIRAIEGCAGVGFDHLQIGSAIFAHKPGDGSAREQAASCQRVLGGRANFANEYATKRYRSNLINWGILPFTVDGEPPFKKNDFVFIPRIVKAVTGNDTSTTAYVISGGKAAPFSLKVPELNPVEKEIVRDGSLINYNRRLRNR
jgi:aconitate hydratase